MTSTHRVVGWIATVTAGALLGVGSAWLWLTRTDPAGTRIGPWLVNLEAGSSDASTYTRARIALKALLALDRRETLYYIAQQDDAGRLLRSNCRYLISGSIPAARWWSVTAYADDIFLFPDAEQRMNLSLKDIHGGLLLVPQFTLAADTRKGTRASFTPAAAPDEAQSLFTYLLEQARESHKIVEAGVFGADMQVHLVNDGPVTFWLQTPPAG